jgi:hypothetical protein
VQARGPGTDTATHVLHYRFALEAVAPTFAEVEKVLGYPPGQASAPVIATTQELLAGPAERWSIEGGCAIHTEVALDHRRHAATVQGLTFALGKIVCGQLAEAEALAAFVCTAGPGIEQLSRSLMSAGDPFTGFIADTLGSLVVENAMDQVQACLARAVGERGLHITERYSPGYCGWRVDEQQKLFQLLPDGFCGVRLTESALMQPIKSVSGFIGIGRRVTRNPYTCRLCDVADCLYRKRRTHLAPADAASPRS